MKVSVFRDPVQIGAWRVEPRARRLSGDGVECALEPKVMDLLMLLASTPGDVVAHEEILAALWPDMIVGDDTLARCVSKLRRGLGDDPKSPRYVETISKRGYRLIAPVTAAPPSKTRRSQDWRWLAAVGAGVAIIGAAALFMAPRALPESSGSAALVARAQDAYFQYTRTENETAIVLYERVLADEPDNAAALAGLARALVQRLLRWPNRPGEPDFSRTTLGEALAQGRTQTPQAEALLERALALATRAADLAPDDAIVLQALGLTRAVRRDLDGAEAAYRQALEIDADAWGALINLGDLEDIRGAPERALPLYERAYETMQRAYEREPQRVRPWQAELGVLIAERHEAAGRPTGAETWYRRVLSQSPLQTDAVAGLARLLRARGETEAARDICAKLNERAGPSAGCGAILTP